MSITALKQALEALEDAQTYISEKYEDHILGYQMHPATESERLVIVDSAKLNEQSITSLRQSIADLEEQEPLTDEEYLSLADQIDDASGIDLIEYGQAVIAKWKEKNGWSS